MAWELTPWDYETDGPLGPLIDAETFSALTSGRYAADSRVGDMIDACTSAIRNYCGWHVAGSVACRAVLDGGESSLWLPSNHVLSVTSVEVLGTPVTCYEWNRQGLLRLPRVPDVLRAVVVEYVAGHDSVPEDLVQLVKERVERALSGARGVTQETAGGVSVSYAPSFATDLGGVSLSASDKDALCGYRLVEAI